MLNLIFTLDYEIHGSGEGSPDLLMVEPTRRLMRCLQRHGLKLTIMAEVAEIGRFKHYAATHGEDRFHAAGIEAQLREAVACAHDVQLHIHPAYDRACWEGDRWRLDWAEYDLARLSYERISALVGEGKKYLEDLLRPVAPAYECVAFRAGHWSMQPSDRIVRALRDRGLRMDTSVFKCGSRSGLVRFDYSNAFSEMVPWPIDPSDVCRPDPGGDLWEVPICCEQRWIWAFLSLSRFHRLWQERAHPMPGGGDGTAEVARLPTEDEAAESGRLARGAWRKLQILTRRHPLKMDFNQCSGRQLIGALERVRRKYRDFPYALPVVLIGHSKLFTAYNERDLEVFLEHVARHPAEYRGSTFGELEQDAMRRAFAHESAGRSLLSAPTDRRSGVA